jgi:tripartite-type tricarboxylate transporter receptor subunit TctC
MRLATTCVLAGLIALAAPATSSSAGDYYAGKSIDLLIGAPPGGGYDIYARALARHYGRHIPGQPTIVSKNMPGAASARAAGFISTLAPKDGTAIAALMPGGVVGPLLDEKAETLFDPTKVLYLGTANNGTRICVSHKDSKIKTFDDALTQKASFGGVSTSDSTRGYGYMHKKTSGAKYDVVSGYSGTAEIAVELIISQQVFQRSYIAPPGLPAELLDTLRSAFDATMRDKDFLHDAETIRIDISPLPGAKVQELVQKIYAAPKDIVARARQAINP